jgi:hypothetical protein
MSIALFIAALIMLVSFAGQKAEWKGDIEYENGIKVINNPREPLYGEVKFELEEELSIGKEGDKNYMFYRIRGIAVDNQGSIYVADMSNHRILKFDRNGRYLQTIGRKGEGPGEFNEPTKLLIDDKTETLYVKDNRKIKVFDLGGNHIKDIFPKKYPIDFILNGDESICAKLSSYTELGEFARDLSKINFQGEILETFESFPFYWIHQKRIEGGWTVGYTNYEHDLFIASIDNQTFLYGFSEKYELNVVDIEGVLLFKIKKNEPPHKFSLKESRKLKKSRVFYKLPPHKPFFYSIITDNNGRIYVQKNKTRGEDFKVNREVDIFSKDGYYLYKSTIPRGTYIIKNDYMYVYVIDENKGDELVKRYKMKNWDQIKEGI